MILVITNNPRITGLQYHRQLVPFKNLKDDFEFEFQTWEAGLDDEYLKKFKMISFLREIHGDVERYKKLGLKVHFDIDDYWVLPSHHELCKVYKENKYGEKTVKAIKSADFVTTTTEYLAERIRQFNKNVYILPNAIDTTEEQWIPNEVKTTHNRLRFGYIAGAHHVRDVEMLHPEFVKLYRDATIKDQWQLLTGGFNFIQEPTGLRANAYYRYVEQCFTNGYGALKKEYATVLASNANLEFKDMDEPYMRLNGLDVTKYGTLYDSIDVALVPLISSEFNRNKSQLKMIEAGFKKRACLVSNVIPYQPDFTDSNCLPTENNEWHKNIKYLLQNRNKVIDLQESLFEYVNSKYRIDIVNVERKQIFEKWLE